MFHRARIPTSCIVIAHKHAFEKDLTKTTQNNTQPILILTAKPHERTQMEQAQHQRKHQKNPGNVLARTDRRERKRKREVYRSIERSIYLSIFRWMDRPMGVSWQHIREKTPLKKTEKKRVRNPHTQKKTPKRSQEREMHAIPPNCGVPLRRWQRSLQVRVKSWREHKNIRRSCRARHRRREDEEDEGELREAHELPQPSDDTSGGRNHARTTHRRFGSNDLWWSLVLQVSDRRTRAAHKGTEIDNRSSTTPTVWNYFYLRKKENRRFLSFTLATSPATAGRRVTRNRWPAARFLLTNCYTPGRPPSNGSTRLSRRNCRSRRDSGSALFLKEICPKVTRTYGSNYVHLRPHTW